MNFFIEVEDEIASIDNSKDTTSIEVSTLIRACEIQRSDSYKRVFGNKRSSLAFKAFLTHVFNIEDPRWLHGVLETIAANKQSDFECFMELKRQLQTRPFGLLYGLKNGVKQILQLRAQKEEIVEETKAILLTHLGDKKRHFNGYVSVGDAGRYVKQLQSQIDIKGPVYIVHDKQTFLLDCVETGSLNSVGRFIEFDYESEPFAIGTGQCGPGYNIHGFAPFSFGQTGQVP